jgi:hypothetical protein
MVKNAQFEDGRPTSQHTAPSGSIEDAARSPHRRTCQMLGKVGALLIGVGIGVGVGLLIAPASGGETRADIVDKVSAFGEKVRDRKPQASTGTHGE